MVRREPLVLAADSRAARIQLDSGGSIFGCHSHLCQKALSIQTPHLLLGQGQTFQEDCNGRIAHLTPQFPLPENPIEPVAVQLYQQLGIKRIYLKELEEEIPSSILITVISEYLVSFMGYWEKLLDEYEIVRDE
jgi:hypothetical protein